MLSSHFDLVSNLVYVNSVPQPCFQLIDSLFIFRFRKAGQLKPYKCLISVSIFGNIGGSMDKVDHLFISLCFGKCHINFSLSLAPYGQLSNVHLGYLQMSSNSSLRAIFNTILPNAISLFVAMLSSFPRIYPV